MHTLSQDAHEHSVHFSACAFVLLRHLTVPHYVCCSQHLRTTLGKVRGLPEASPCNRILPLFNTMAFFAVEPGVSYHSVQEVFTDRSPRISIQVRTEYVLTPVC